MERSLPQSNSLSRRVFSAFVFVPPIVFIIYLGGPVFACMIAILIILALRELYAILEAGGLAPSRVAGYLLSTAVCLFCFYYADRPLHILAGFSVMLLAALILFGAGSLRRRTSPAALSTLGSVLYVGWLFSLQIPLRETGSRFLPGSPMNTDATGWLLLLFCYCLVWTCDTSAYFVGRRFGRRKLVPAVSPGKTVEGAIGGFLFTVLVASLFRSLLIPQMHAGTAVLLGMTAGVMSQIGDVFESALKRKGSMKDSSGMIPGHGGILDRFDGMLFALPSIYYILLSGTGFPGLH